MAGEMLDSGRFWLGLFVFGNGYFGNWLTADGFKNELAGIEDLAHVNASFHAERFK